MRLRFAVALLGAAVCAGPRVAGAADAVRIDEPAEDEVVGREVRVVGRVPVLPARAEGVLRVNGVDVPFERGAFSTVLAVEKDGPFVIRAVFSEIGAPATVAERTVVVDLTPPVIEVDEPQGDVGEYATQEVTVRGSARDANLARVRMNDREVALDRDGGFAVLFLLPASGTMDVEIEASDRIGNRSTAKRSLRYVPKADSGGAPPPTPPPTDPRERAIHDALRWLAAHQGADGGWSCAGWDGVCDGKPTGGGLDGKGKPAYDAGVTGLALLAFLRAGYGERGDSPFANVVSGGLRWLKAAQDGDGCFGPRTSGHYVYGHAAATRAMVEAYRAGGSSVHRASAQKGLDFVAAARNPGFAWRYGVRPGDNDTSVTGWMTAALEAGRDAARADARAGRTPSLRIDLAALDGARAWIVRVTDPQTGRGGYETPGSGSARPPDLVDRFPAERSEAMTAVGILVRLAAGEAAGSQVIARGVQLCAKRAPVWNTADGSIDLYYWFFGTEALARVGGPAWTTWRQALLDAVLTRQRTDGDACRYAGSWDPVDPWGQDGGRVYSTAIVALALETAATPASAGAGVPPAATADAKARLRELRERVNRWVLLREKLSNPCDLCNGRGRLRTGNCPRCLGRGWLFNTGLRKAYVDMRSPAWRARPEADQDFRAFYEGIQAGKTPAPRLTSSKLGELALVDETHAIAPIFENKEISPTPSRWVWASEQAFPKGTWYLYAEGVDGPWPN